MERFDEKYVRKLHNKTVTEQTIALFNCHPDNEY